MTWRASRPCVWITRSTDIVSVNFEHLLVPQYSGQLQIDSGSPTKINWRIGDEKIGNYWSFDNCGCLYIYNDSLQVREWRRGKWGFGWGEDSEFRISTFWTWRRRWGRSAWRIQGSPISGIWWWWRRRNLMVIPKETHRAASWPMSMDRQQYRQCFFKFFKSFNSTIFKSTTYWQRIANTD